MNNRIPQAIKFAVVATVAPRWIIAFLAAEGLVIPDGWIDTWTVVSTVLAAAFAITDGFAFSYVFERWADMRKGTKNRNLVLGFAVASAVVFVAVLGPSMAASVRGMSMSEYFGDSELFLNLWTICIGLSAMLIVITVGIAQDKSDTSQDDPELKRTKDKLRESNKQITALEKELLLSNEKYTKLSSELGIYAGLASDVKKDKIVVALKLWGDKIKHKDIASMFDATQSQVSRINKEKE